MPKVFLSAVTAELRDWRIRLHRAFSEAGCEVVVEEYSLGPVTQDVMRALEAKLDGVDLVVHLAGFASGTVPTPDLLPGLRCAYTQAEFYHPARRDQRVAAFVLGAGFGLPEVDEPEEARALQAEHRRRLVEGDYAGTGVSTRYLGRAVETPHELWQWIPALVVELTGLEDAGRPIRALHQLPAPPHGFVGRTRELAELRKAEGPVLLSGLKGMGGIGKTALALVLAHEWAARLGDVQLWLDGRGTSAKPPTGGALLEQAIRAFHPTARLPEDPSQLRAIYLDCLKGRQALVVVDNAKDAAQVAPLLPPDGCGLIVTSRRAFMLGTVAARPVGRLSTAEADALLRALYPGIGDTTELVRLCAGLPLALRVAGAHLALDAAERGGVADVAGYLRKLRSGRLATIDLDAEDAGEITVSETLRLSEDQLGEGEREAWRKLGVFAGSFDAEAAWVVAGVEDVDVYVRRSLLEREGDRVRMHDLAAEYAVGLVGDVEGVRRGHAEYFLGVLTGCDEAYLEGRPVEGLARFDRERQEIEAAQAWAVGAGATGLVLLSGDAGAHILNLRLDARAQVCWFNEALAAAVEMRDRQTEGAMLCRLGLATAAAGELQSAVDLFERQLRIAREVGDWRSEGSALGNLGMVWASLGEVRSAIALHERALDIVMKLGDIRGVGAALNNLGMSWADVGEEERALSSYDMALNAFREIRDRQGEGATLGNIGTVHLTLGNPRAAIRFYEEQLAIVRELGDRNGEGNALSNLGTAWAGLGDPRRAIAFHEDARRIAREIGDRLGECADFGNIGNAWLDLDQPSAALDCFSQVRRWSVDFGDRRSEASACYNLARALDALDQTTAALGHAEEATRLFREIESPHAERAAALVARLRAAIPAK